MPSSKKGPANYPLQAIARQRELARSDRARGVRDALATLEDRERRLAEASAEVESIEARLAAARQARTARLRAGSRASDIHAGIAHETALASLLARARSRRDDASALRREAAARLETCRADLARADAEVRAVEHHRDGWSERLTRAADLRAEEDP